MTAPPLWAKEPLDASREEVWSGNFPSRGVWSQPRSPNAATEALHFRCRNGSRSEDPGRIYIQPPGQVGFQHASFIRLIHFRFDFLIYFLHSSCRSFQEFQFTSPYHYTSPYLYTFPYHYTFNMRSSTILFGLAAATVINAQPFDLFKRAISPDGTCGGAKGYTCPGSAKCCSQWGWCGSTAEYCGTGCQPGFGTCGSGSVTTTTARTTTTSTTARTTSSTTSRPGTTTTLSTTLTTRTSTQSSTPTGVRGIPRPKIGSVPYGSVLYNCVRPGDIAMTFDDGPYLYTGDLLNTLNRLGVKATFFVVGSNGNGDIDKVQQWSDLIRRAYNEGHQVASHTWRHEDLTTLTSAARRETMYLTEQALANILGVFPTYMRPPYLSFNAEAGADMADLGYHVISTNLDPRDWENNTPETVYKSQQAFNDATSANPASASFIVLNHDIHRTTVYTLVEGEVNRLRARGYRPVTVGQCLGDPQANWYRAAAPARRSL